MNFIVFCSWTFSAQIYGLFSGPNSWTFDPRRGQSRPSSLPEAGHHSSSESRRSLLLSLKSLKIVVQTAVQPVVHRSSFVVQTRRSSLRSSFVAEAVIRRSSLKSSFCCSSHHCQQVRISVCRHFGRKSAVFHDHFVRLSVPFLNCTKPFL